MSYVELGDTLFRGTLKGATGDTQFKLTADAINVVDTINIQDGSVTYTYNSTFSVPASTNAVFSSHSIYVTKGSALTLYVHSNRLKNFRVNGSTYPRSVYYGNDAVFPVVGLIRLDPGVHTIDLVASSSGTASGYIYVQIVRDTGELA